MDRDRNRDREKTFGERGGLYNIKFMGGTFGLLYGTSLRKRGLHIKKAN
jgi:hypothetical protein